MYAYIHTYTYIYIHTYIYILVWFINVYSAGESNRGDQTMRLIKNNLWLPPKKSVALKEIFICLKISKGMAKMPECIKRTFPILIGYGFQIWSPVESNQWLYNECMGIDYALYKCCIIIVVGVMKMGNIVPRAGNEPTSLAFYASVLPLHHIGFPDVMTMSTPTCLSSSLPERSVPPTTLLYIPWQ